MKRNLLWHRDCLWNIRAHYERIKLQISQLEADYARGQKELNAYDAQIIRAEEKGLTEFDRDRFGKVRTGE